MKKKYLKVSNLLCASLITMLGLGACKSSRHVDQVECVYGPPPEYEEEMLRAKQQQEEMERQAKLAEEKKRLEAEKIKLVYGPPPSQRREQLYVQDNDGIYDTVEQMPQFPGGQQALETWIAEHQQVRGEGGRVLVSFIVEPDGSLDGLRVVKSASEAHEKEAFRLLHEMPKWQPGRHQGKAVRVRYVLPINF